MLLVIQSTILNKNNQTALKNSSFPFFNVAMMLKKAVQVTFCYINIEKGGKEEKNFCLDIFCPRL